MPLPQTLMRKLVLFTSLITLFACDPGKSGSDVIDTDKNPDFEVVAHLPADPDGLHPCNNVSINMAYVFESIHRRLFRVDLPTLMLTPDLATDLPERIDSTTFRYSLRDDVTWDDGTPLTSADVRFTLLLSMCPLTNNPQKRTVIADFVDSVSIIDEQHLIFKTKYPYAGANHIWSDLPIVSEKFYDPKGLLSDLKFSDFKNDPALMPQKVQDWFAEFNSRKYSHKPEFINGLGAYKLTYWEEGQYLTAERKEGWWGKGKDGLYFKANPKTIHFKVIKDEETTNQALMNGEIDVAYALSSVEAHDLLQSEDFKKNFHFNNVDIFGLSFVALNTRPAPDSKAKALADVDVREALCYATPYSEILDEIYNMGSRQVSIVCPKRPYYHKDLPLKKLDLDRANEILDGAGWVDTDGDGVRDKVVNGEKHSIAFELGYGDNPGYKAMAELIAEHYLKIGVSVKPKPVDPNEMFPILLSQNFDAFITSLIGDGGFEDLSQILHTRSWDQKGLNFTGFGNAKSDSILEAINRTFDIEQRHALYRELQEEFARQNTFIMLFAVQRKIAVSKRFKAPEVYAEKPSILLNALELAQ